MTKPLVTIICITYNHENFISETIDGFLMQKTDFPFEIIIHDDCSTDNTRNVIQKYADENNELIKPIYQKQNIYSQGIKPMTVSLPHSEGKYIALCEGDDYWTDPNKLQKQVNFLENNSDFSICYHDVSILENGNFVDSHVPVYDKEFLTIIDLAKENCIHTPTCVFRNKLFDHFPVFFNSSPAGDYVLHLLNAQHGKIKHLPEKMAVYRRHSGGVWAGRQLPSKLASWLEVLSPLIIYFKDYPEVRRELEKQHLNTLLRLVKISETVDDKEFLINGLEKMGDWEVKHIAQHIIETKSESNKVMNNYANIDFIINQISLKDAIKLALKKLYYTLRHK